MKKLKLWLKLTSANMTTMQNLKTNQLKHIRKYGTAKGAKGFTTNFDDLGQTDGSHFDQIPGLASQRLMAEGYGFGAEGDWKSAALYRTVWVMNQGLANGCSFLEDYTLNFDGKNSSILQAHMLEVCPLIAAKKPRLEVHFLGIGIRKSQTARLVFTSKVGTGCTATVVDLGNRFRLIVNDVECIEPKPLPKLPVASALWKPMPDFETGAGAWILAGGTHQNTGKTMQKSQVSKWFISTKILLSVNSRKNFA